MNKEQPILEETTIINENENVNDSENDDDLSSGSDSENEILVKKVIKISPEDLNEDNIEKLAPKPMQKPKKKYIKKEPKIVSTNDPNINVIVKARNKGKKPKKQIIIYKEDLEDEDDEPQIIVKSKQKGRPKQKKIIKYIDQFGNEIDPNKKQNATEVIIPLPSKEKELSDKDLKIIELETRLTELSQISNKNIRGTKKGKPDQRQIRPRTEKQIAQAKRLVEMNKLKRLEKQKIKDEENKKTQKTAVKEVIVELSNVKKETDKKDHEINQKIIEEKKHNYYYNDPLFN